MVDLKRHGRFTSPFGRGRRVAPGEGLRSLLGQHALTRFAAQIDLSPFINVRDCPSCKVREVYYPDRIRSSGASLISFDRGHVAPQLLEPVEAARVRREHVQDDVEIVRDDPGTLPRAGDTLR